MWKGLRPPTLYKGTDLIDLHLVGSDMGSDINSEGHHFQKIDGSWYAFVMQQNGRAFAYDLSMNAIGMVPPLPPAPSGQQPCYIAIPADGTTEYLWVNNDGTRYPYFIPDFGVPGNETRGTILTLKANKKLNHYDFKEWIQKSAIRGSF
jgi:hypothetical protein